MRDISDGLAPPVPRDPTQRSRNQREIDRAPAAPNFGLDWIIAGIFPARSGPRPQDTNMAKTNYQFERRQRELKKSQQQEEKRQKKRERKEATERTQEPPESTS